MNIVLATFFIFTLRVIDQSLGTMRALYVNKGKPYHAALLGFIESIIWILAISQVIRDIEDPLLVIGYAAGFAAGTILGSYMEQTIGIGSIVVKVFASVESPSVAQHLRDEGYGVTVINGEGKDGAVRIYWCIIPRRKLKSVLKLISKVNPDAYVTTDSANPTALNK